MAKANNHVDIRTEECRFAFVHVDKPEKREFDDNSSKEQFSVTGILSPEDGKRLRDKCVQLAVKEWGKEMAKRLFDSNKLRIPVKSNTDAVSLQKGERYNGFDDDAGFHLQFATEYDSFHVVDSAKNKIDPTVPKSGDYGFLAGRLKPYSNQGSYGITCYLSAVMLVRAGESLGGEQSVDDIFGDLEVEDGFVDSASEQVNDLFGGPGDGQDVPVDEDIPF